MEWQLLAMWMIALTTMLWFVRDERRLRAAVLARQARYFASPAYKHPRRFGPAPITVPLPPRRQPSSLLRTDRAYFDKLLSERPRR